jgi:hypothetical protein
MESGATAWEARHIARQFENHSLCDERISNSVRRAAIIAEALNLLADKKEAERNA